MARLFAFILAVAASVFADDAKVQHAARAVTTEVGVNLGTIPAFMPPPSCTELTGLVRPTELIVSSIYPVGPGSSFSIEVWTSWQGVLDYLKTRTVLKFHTTDMYGAGEAWREYNAYSAFYSESHPAAPQLESTLRLDTCFPPKLGTVGSSTGYQTLASNYFSPAYSCPSGWDIATSTVRTTGATTETAALCCRPGWRLNYYQDGCESEAPGVLTAPVYLDVDAYPSLVYSTVSAKILPTTVRDLAFQVRWQLTDLPATARPSLTSGATATGSSKTDGASTSVASSSVASPSGAATSGSTSSAAGSTGGAVATASSSDATIAMRLDGLTSLASLVFMSLALSAAAFL